MVGTYDNVDRFGRVTSSRWTRYAVNPADMYRVDLTYDRNSSILTADDAILTGGSAGTIPEWDVQYSLDNLGRVLRAKEGKLASGAVADADRDRDERWQNTSGNGALSPTGNWDRRRLDLNGDGDYIDAGEIDDTGTYNKANEWLTRDTDTNGTANFTLTHDAVGNTTDDGKDYTYKYDAFGRLVEVKNRATAALVAEYRYNGMYFRTGWRYDASGNGSVSAPPTSPPWDWEDPWYWFAHDERWRIVATFRHTDSTAKERYVWHSAGLDGHGGSSYIDSVILRDKDANTAWTTASDGTLEERLYYAQNWRADVSLVLSSTGQLKERIKYSAYGVPFCMSPADYNGDATVDQFDYLDFMADYDVENVRADINFDGITDFYDYLDYIAEYDSGNGESGGGRSSLSRASINNRIGYAGYQWDPSIRGSITSGGGTGGASAGKYHVRHRVLDAGQGRWTRRDPLGYVDGTSVYEYVRSNPIMHVDPQGLGCKMCFSCTIQSDVSGGCFGLRRKCTYLCVENQTIPRRNTSHGTLDCDEIPEPLYYLDYESAVGSCAPTRNTCQDIWDNDEDAPWRNKGFKQCMQACDDTKRIQDAICNRLLQPWRGLCKASAAGMHELCTAYCEAQDDVIGPSPPGGGVGGGVSGEIRFLDSPAARSSAGSGVASGNGVSESDGGCPIVEF